MLSSVDRIQAVVRNREATAERYQRLLGAEVESRDRLSLLGAHRCTLALGHSYVELLEADGSGPVADFLKANGPGLFAAGVATARLEELLRHLESRGVRGEREADQLFLSPQALGVGGLRIVVSAQRERRAAGLVDFLYEVTHLHGDARVSGECIAELFGLRKDCFAPIVSAEYGYDGILTLFHRDRLDRLETITPRTPANTMGRFFAKRGPSLYMCFAESSDTAALRERLIEHADGDWSGPRDGAAPDMLFIHPKALGGTMLGVSRTSVAWTWSGKPERVARNEGQ